LKKRTTNTSFPISWHQECLSNWRAKSFSDRVNAEHRLAIIAEQEQRIAEYEAQIQLAITEGKESFDRERYGVKRKKASS
jgi:hypothetical protein